jgi:hypothetical protein
LVIMRYPVDARTGRHMVVLNSDASSSRVSLIGAPCQQQLLSPPSGRARGRDLNLSQDAQPPYAKIDVYRRYGYAGSQSNV